MQLPDIPKYLETIEITGRNPFSVRWKFTTTIASPTEAKQNFAPHSVQAVEIKDEVYKSKILRVKKNFDRKVIDTFRNTTPDVCH